MKPSNFNPRRLSNRLVVLCVAVLGVILLYPYDFSLPFREIENTAEARSDGIDFGNSGMLRSAVPPPLP
jgi:hypothetical protein